MKISIPSMRIAAFLSLCAMALTAACGGGGGGSSPPAPVAPTISTQPANQSVSDGAKATFSVVADGGGASLTYQWQKGTASIAGATSASYVTPALTLSNSGSSYSVVVTDAAGSVTSNSASVTVTAIAPTIKTQPADQSVSDGATATFHVVASGGSSALTYQWKKGSTNIAGATQDSYRTSSLTVADSGGTYSVVVTDTAGNITSNTATVTVNAVLPTITTQPVSQTVNSGAMATFTVAASAGSSTLTYQWRKATSSIGGATSASYTTPALTVPDSGSSYSVIVSDSKGNVTSTAATVTVNAPAGPTITTQPLSQTKSLAAPSTTATFTVAATTGSLPLTYQWRKNGSPIGGATNASYTTPALTPADNGSTYSVVVRDAASNTTTSNAATLTLTHTLSLLAGKIGGVGDFNNGGTPPATSATFHYPDAIAFDSAHNLVYVADTASQTIRKIDVAANTVADYAGTPNIAGFDSMHFRNPRGVAVDASGVVYVADTDNNVIVKIVGGAVQRFAGSVSGAAGFINGAGLTAAQFNSPRGLAIDGSGNVYVADYGNNAIRMITPLGVVSTFAGTGSAGLTDGAGSLAQFNGPTGVAVDGSGNVYVTDWLNNVIRKITSLQVVSTLAGSTGPTGYGEVDGALGTAKFNGPTGLSIDAGTNLYVADYGNNAIRVVALPSGNVTTFAGSVTSAAGYTDALGTAARFSAPAATAVDSAGGFVYVADLSNNLIRSVTVAGASVGTLAGNIGGRGYVDGLGGIGPSAVARFSDAADVAHDLAGNLYVADYHNNVIRKIDVNGNVTTLAGSGSPGWVDAQGNSAQFNGPNGVAVDSHGNVYVADAVNFVIRKITPGGMVSTYAGTVGTPGSLNGACRAGAQFYHPYSVATDSNDNLYVADYDNDTIRKITPPTGTCTVSTLAGIAGQAGSNDSPNPTFYGPRGVATDAAGNVYVADLGNDTIRMITPGGAVSTLAGMAGTPGSSDGTGSGALFNAPSGVSVDSASNVYVADYGNHTIRQVTSGGVVTTVAGAPTLVGVLGSVASGPVLLPASLNGPTGVDVLPGSVPGTHVKLAVAEDTENAVLLVTLP